MIFKNDQSKCLSYLEDFKYSINLLLILNILCLMMANHINIHKSSMYKHHFVYLPLTGPDWEASFGYSISGSQIYEDIWLRKLIKKLMMIIPKY